MTDYSLSTNPSIETETSNVVQLKVRRRKLVKTVKVILDEPKELEEGDLVAFTFPTVVEDQEPWPTMFAAWAGPTGRDRDGRFVKAGSENEAYRIGGCLYSPKEIVLLGRIRYGLPAEEVPILVDVPLGTKPDCN